MKENSHINKMTKVQNVWKTKYLQTSSQYGDVPLHWQLTIGNWQLLYCCMCKSQFPYSGYPGPVYEEIHLLEAISSCFLLWRTDRNKSRRRKALPLLYIIHPFYFSQITFPCSTSHRKGNVNLLLQK